MEGTHNNPKRSIRDLFLVTIRQCVQSLTFSQLYDMIDNPPSAWAARPRSEMNSASILRPQKKPSYLFGTTDDVDFQLASAGARRQLRVSETHFRLEFNHHGSWMLVDLSSNGTWACRENLCIWNTLCKSQSLQRS
jgi:hypothetical protein